MDLHYESELEWFRKYMNDNYNSTSRRIREYCDYLNRWFSEDRCDGAPNYETRHRWKYVPMSYNQYMLE